IEVTASTENPTTTIPGQLANFARMTEADATNASDPRPFLLEVNPFTINGVKMDMNVINERIRMGDVEIWELSNPNMQAHPFHVHGEPFQILSRNGALPPPNERGWKDVVLIRPDEVVRIIKRFDDFSDSSVPYMYHCHILEHEDVGMMGTFTVEDF
ncbi:MAG: multicopper oxidase domain-containing protein, partial [Kofleriaceae bacterium]|nr:multicopper oxidase domain-containing protein [Kofleriaceae bacterium]